MPLLLPDDPEVMVIQLALLIAVHAQDDVTVTLSVLAAAATEALAAPSAGLHAVTITVALAAAPVAPPIVVPVTL